MTEFYCEPLIGYRPWQIQALWGAKGPGLSGFFRCENWPTYGPMTAECDFPEEHHRTTGPPPVPGCSCGVYATHELSGIRPSTMIEPYQGFKNVVGAVVAWGRIVYRERGFRAQYMLPIALLDPDVKPRWYDDVLTVSQEYQLPLLDGPDLIDYAQERGRSLGTT